MREFEQGVAAGTHESGGWPSAAYAVSKSGLIAATEAVAGWERGAAEREGRGPRGVCSVCPGWVDTDMTKGKGPRTVDEGAKTPVGLAVGTVGGEEVVGGFWKDGEKVAW